MKKILEILKEDHHLISLKLSELQSLLPLNPSESFERIVSILGFFSEFTFKGHHQREGEVLYAWMTKQNKNADRDLMNRIKDEHSSLEALVLGILEGVKNFLIDKKNINPNSVLADLSLMITKYNEHIEREEDFIFMIAESLILSESEEREMILKMEKTYKQ